MINQDILKYIQAEQSRGVGRPEIMQALTNAGWKLQDVEETFASMSGASLVAATSSPEGHGSLLQVTEKNYPITTLWLFKSPIIVTVITICGLFFHVWFPYLVLAAIVWLISNPLIRKNFHYGVDEKFFVIQQGVFSKKQRNMPYGVIQNVLVKQDLFDRVFGLASLRVEDATKGGKGISSFKMTGITRNQGDIGASGNKVDIPGLKKADAEALKAILLQKMKENPTDSQSGL